MISYHRPEADELEAITRFDVRQFGDSYDPTSLEHLAKFLELDRFVVATDGEDIVGASGAYSMELVVPGQARLDASGVTWISVTPTHTRRGILREMISRVHDDARERNESVAMLTASEGNIYERFGYGIATHHRRVEIDARQATFRPEQLEPQIPLRLVGKDEAIDHLWPIWQKVWDVAPAGEVSRSEPFLVDRFRSSKDDFRFFLADDGFAAYRIDARWNDGVPGFKLEIVTLQAASLDTRKALWRAILAVDLVGPIEAWIGVDDPLPYWLENGRLCQTKGGADFLWVLVLDPVTAFSARSYQAQDRLVIRTPQGIWSIGSDGTEAVSETTEPDIEASHSCLGALLLGGVSASTLLAGGRLTARSPDVVVRADRLFTTATAPRTTTGF